jgi:protein-S-isoprenylcysteine O-methyltransferase Ste14
METEINRFHDEAPLVKDRAAVIAPPPLLTVFAIGAGLLADHFVPIAIVPGIGATRFVLFGFLLLVAATFIFSGLAQLMTHHEHPSPYKPTVAIVAGGIYRFTRNPIYVGFIIIGVAIAVVVNTVWLLLASIALFLALHFGVVKAEERYLSAKFGDTYDDYRRRVRRWI